MSIFLKLIIRINRILSLEQTHKKSIYSITFFFPDGINIKKIFFVYRTYYFSRRVFHIQQDLSHRKNETSISLQNLDKNVDLVTMR
jgi:sugar phosphate permease